MKHAKQYASCMSEKYMTINERRELVGYKPIRAGYTPDQWQQLVGDDMPRFANIRNPIKQPSRIARVALIVIFVAFGMALAAVAYSNAYARGIDAINNPHIEGF